MKEILEKQMGEHKEEVDKYLILWLDQENCERLTHFLYRLPQKYADEVEACYGRAGRGRLWVPKGFDLKGIEWDQGKPAASDAQHCAGIVISIKDVQLFNHLPGFITDINLNYWHDTRI